MTVSEIAKKANSAALVLAHLSTDKKNQVLEEMANVLEENCDAILSANEKDLQFANEEGIAKPLIARLTLNENKVRGMAQGIRSVVALPDPAGVRQSAMEIDEGLTVYRVSCPIGVIGAIFESRPDAVPQISSLCLKSGNAVILKGGREAQNSNKIIVGLLTDAIKKVAGVPEAAVQMIETRSEVADMLKEEKYINLIVPRGSNDFVKYIQENTRIPVLGHSEGICHNYIDREADLSKALRIALDSKLQYPAACNAMENLLVHRDVASEIIPQLVEKFQGKGVSLVGCDETCKIATELSPASESEWDEEYNDLKLAIKIVEDLEQAISFINKHGSGHTDTIITENAETAEEFMNGVNSASVMCNASTRFADGFRYGLGAEIGISTNKTHARGPVGLEGLVIYKYRVYGKGQIVSDYSGENARSFTHKPLWLKKVVQNKRFDSDVTQESDFEFDDPTVPVKKNWRLFYILLTATLVTTYLAGGLLFSLSLLLILGAHEFGHYWASKKNAVQSTLPYFIPAPPMFIAGTFGAFIQIKQRIPNRRVLMEIGAAGPIAGFVVALPMLALGLYLSQVTPSVAMGGINFGSSFILNLFSEMILGVDPSSPFINIHLHPIAFAGWIGMLVTALNLMPVGQLDGGHIIYALFPDKHRLIGKLFFVALFPLGYFWSGWFFWAVMIALMGFKTAPLKEESGNLETFHKVLGVVSMLIFMLTFIPIPFSQI